MTKGKATSPKAASAASKTLRDGRTAAASKAAAGSALSQVARSRTTSPQAAKSASKTLRSPSTSAASKSAAGSALSQKPASKGRGKGK